MSKQDIYRIDKPRVRAAFGRAAGTYDAAAVVQKQVREEMLQRLDWVKINPQVILDAGCGTGIASLELQQKFNKSQVISLDFAYPMLQKMRQLNSRRTVGTGWIGEIANLLTRKKIHQSLLCADIESLPLADTSVDLLWSNLAIQWCNDLDATLREFYRALCPEGLLMFSTFGPDTLRELRIATQAPEVDALEFTRVNRFIDMHDIGDALIRAGFNAPVLDVERFTLTYADVKGVMRDLKNIGAQNATMGRPRGLQGRGFLQKLTKNYEQFRINGKLPVTFEVVYGHAWRGQNKPANLAEGVVPITFQTRAKK